MTQNWGGAQWILLAYWASLTVMPPLFRWALLREAPDEAAALLKELSPPGIKLRTWPEFWRQWQLDLIRRLVLAVMLAWGGFW